jgi:hypothetical protein
LRRSAIRRGERPPQLILRRSEHRLDRGRPGGFLLWPLFVTARTGRKLRQQCNGPADAERLGSAAQCTMLAALSAFGPSAVDAIIHSDKSDIWLPKGEHEPLTEGAKCLRKLILSQALGLPEKSPSSRLL